MTITGPTFSLKPVIPSISPAAIASGSANTVITVTGTGFINGSNIVVGFSQLSTSYVSPTQISATVPASTLASLGRSPVTVATPARHGKHCRAGHCIFYRKRHLRLQPPALRPLLYGGRPAARIPAPASRCWMPQTCLPSTMTRVGPPSTTTRSPQPASLTTITANTAHRHFLASAASS